MATAKAMAHVNNIPLLGVNSIEIIGANLEFCNRNICSILDAEGNQVYMNKYILKDDKITELEEISIKPIDELLEEISSSNEEWVLVREAVYKYKEKIIRNCTIEVFLSFYNNIYNLPAHKQVLFKYLPKQLIGTPKYIIRCHDGLTSDWFDSRLLIFRQKDIHL